MRTRRVLPLVVTSFALGAAACGGFLGLTGDDDPPASPMTTPDAGGDTAVSTTSEGGSSVGDASPPGDDAGGFVYGATCGGTRCMPDVPCCVPTGATKLACEVIDGDCTSMFLRCTRRNDCANGENCCVTFDPDTSTTLSKCVPGACPTSTGNQLCDPADKEAAKDCAPLACQVGGAASTTYKLPETLGVCE